MITQFVLPQPILTAIKLLNDANFECFVVGGAVRNFLLQQPIDDYDLTTSAKPDEIMQVFSEYKTVLTGKKHGTITVIIDHFHIEITTYRTEKEYIEHRFPKSVSFTTNRLEDMKRRDFTINSLCYYPKYSIIDDFHGIDDLNHKCIRCIGNPDQRFKEDALRILRAIRFACRLHFEIEEHTKQAIFENQHLLNYISYQRKISELEKILTTNYLPYLDTYLSVFQTFLPIQKKHLQLLKKQPKQLEIFLALLFLDQPNQEITKYLSKKQNLIIQDCLLHQNDDLTNLDDLLMLRIHTKCPIEYHLTFHSILHQLDINHTLQQLKAYAHLPIRISDLAIKTEQLLQLGYQGKQIKHVQQFLLEQITKREITNTPTELLQYLLKNQ